jgi:hypothetical protein
MSFSRANTFGFNQRKRLLLTVLAEAFPYGLRADAIACKAGVSPKRAVYWRLNRLWQFGLLQRRRTQGSLLYRITKRGRERLAWLRQNT